MSTTFYDVTTFKGSVSPYYDIGTVINEIIADIKAQQTTQTTRPGAVIYVPPGHYNLLTRVVIDISFLQIKGAGHGFLSQAIRDDTTDTSQWDEILPGGSHIRVMNTDGNHEAFLVSQTGTPAVNGRLNSIFFQDFCLNGVDAKKPYNNGKIGISVQSDNDALRIEGMGFMYLERPLLIKGADAINITNNYNGQFGLPYQCNVQGIFYNKELFDKAGVPYPTDETTYEDFIEMIKKLKASGVTPLAIGSKNSAFAMWEFNEFLARYGWEDAIESILNGNEKFNNKEFTACFEKLQGMKDANAFPENMVTIEYFDAKQLFDEGHAAMFGTGQWDCEEFDENIGDKIGFWWGPKFTDTQNNQNIAMKVPSAPIGVSASVADNEDLKEGVYEFLKFYYGEEAAKISYEGSIFPATSYEGISASDSQYSMNAMVGDYIIVSAMVMLLYLNGYWRVR